MVIFENSLPWPTAGSRLGPFLGFLWLSSSAQAFLLRPPSVVPVPSPGSVIEGSHYQGSHSYTTLLQASKPLHHKHRPTSDRSSSTTLTGSRVVSHVSDLYQEGQTYKKTIKKTDKTTNHLQQQTNHPKATIPTNTLLNELNRYPSLVLNADYQPMSYLPLSVCHWQEAVKLIFSGKVAVVDVYEGVTIRAANIEVPLPSVVALSDYVPQCSHKPAFTRRNVFLRDEYTCQYCSNPFHTKDLSIDHVVPRSMGGRLNWENAVTSCLKCNGRKGSMMVSDLKAVGMKLQTKPRAPTRHELAMKAGKMLPRKVHPTWQPFLGSVIDDDGNNKATPDLESLGIGPNGEPTMRQQRKTSSKNNKKKRNNRRSQKLKAAK